MTEISQELARQPEPIEPLTSEENSPIESAFQKISEVDRSHEVDDIVFQKMKFRRYATVLSRTHSPEKGDVEFLVDFARENAVGVEEMREHQRIVERAVRHTKRHTALEANHAAVVESREKLKELRKRYEEEISAAERELHNAERRHFESKDALRLLVKLSKQMPLFFEFRHGVPELAMLPVNESD